VARTASEWQELYRRLRGVADDPEEEYVRRQRALAIIETIPREYRHAEQKPAWITEYNPDFEGII
jgi:hypothetical protein